MRCDYCPLSNPEDTCPEAEGEYGIEHKDGVCGCRHPWNWAHKRDMMYADALGEMGLDRGIEMDFTPEELERVTEICKHMVGKRTIVPSRLACTTKTHHTLDADPRFAGDGKVERRTDYENE